MVHFFGEVRFVQLCEFPLECMVDTITPERAAVDFIVVMVHCLCDHRTSFPSLLLVCVVSVEKQNTSPNKRFVMWIWRWKRGDLGSHS